MLTEFGQIGSALIFGSVIGQQSCWNYEENQNSQPYVGVL